mmetsp:Transcript_153814/g.271443  ORF Transcript_153814/g.271443 Transcript_153814/m.271443 type:complete len:523 (-) Transcript_153814:113-1681(-)
MSPLDTFFPYPTPKIARIKDSRLGLLRWSLICGIFAYVLIYQIMWKGNHLEMAEITGVHQMTLSHPTRGNCNPMDVSCMQNFSSMADLPYCAQSPIQSSIHLPCEFWDAASLRQITDEGMLIPTHYSQFRQTKGCKPSAINNWTCVGWLYDFMDKKGHVQLVRGQAKPVRDVFIADVERFTLRIDHSVKAHVGARAYDYEMAGSLIDCASTYECTQRPLNCTRTDGCPTSLLPANAQLVGQKPSPPRVRGTSSPLALLQTDVKPGKWAPGRSRSRPRDKQRQSSLLAAGKDKQMSLSAAGNETPGLPRHSGWWAPELIFESTDEGDVFSIAALLRAANVSMDQRRHSTPSYIGGSYRSSGFVLVIRLYYSNHEPWLGLKVWPWRKSGPTMRYTYRVTKHASHEDFVLRKVAPGSTAEDRLVDEYHGIRILIEQSGVVAVWDNLQLLLILTTTLALMAVSSCITDTYALYILPEKDEYWAIKYERPRKKQVFQVQESESADEQDQERLGGTAGSSESRMTNQI